MSKYVIESEMLGVGRLSAAELQSAAQHGVSVLNEMEPHIQWMQSFVTADKIYVIYAAPDFKETDKILFQNSSITRRTVNPNPFCRL